MARKHLQPGNSYQLQLAALAAAAVPAVQQACWTPELRRLELAALWTYVGLYAVVM